MIEIDYDLGRQLARDCLCECGANLSLVWGGTYGVNSYVLMCGRVKTHDKITLVKSITQLWKEGYELPPGIAERVEKKHRRELMEQENVRAMVTKADAQKLSKYVQARFPKDLEKPQAALDFAQWCISHQLEPIRDCVPYQGRPLITVEWFDRQAAADEKYRGCKYKIYTQEQKRNLDFAERDLVIECEGMWEGLTDPLMGLGVVTIEEREAKSERNSSHYRSPIVAAHPQQMCFKRARAAALKQRYHAPAPILEELPYTSVVEAEYRVVDIEGPGLDKHEPDVVAEAGEPPDGLEETTEATTEPSAPRRASGDIRENEVPDADALQKVAYQVWGLQPKALWAELSYKSIQEFLFSKETPWQAFLRIKSARG